MKYLRDLIASRRLLQTLILNEFSKQYLGSYFGLFWAFAQPIIYIVVIWFVFTIGFRRGELDEGVPFFLWLIAGMIPWFFFANSLSSATNAITSNAYLLKKVAFRASLLPIVQIGSAFLIHAVLLVFLFLSAILYGQMPTLYWLQIIYYVLLSILLLVGITWLTSSLRVFIKDVSNFIAVVVQVGFWATPIFWQSSKIPEEYSFVLYLNPMHYIIDGFRDALFSRAWFWQKPLESLSFFIILVLVLIVGYLVFKRLRPHFGDVL